MPLLVLFVAGMLQVEKPVEWGNAPESASYQLVPQRAHGLLSTWNVHSFISSFDVTAFRAIWYFRTQSRIVRLSIWCGSSNRGGIDDAQGRKSRGYFACSVKNVCIWLCLVTHTKENSYAAKVTPIPHLPRPPDMLLRFGNCVDDAWHSGGGRAGVEAKAISKVRTPGCCGAYESVVLEF